MSLYLHTPHASCPLKTEILFLFPVAVVVFLCRVDGAGSPNTVFGGTAHKYQLVTTSKELVQLNHIDQAGLDLSL
jgi:hypothetical protein